MRGILFCVSFFSLCLGVLVMGDAAVAAPLSVAPAQALWSWAWFALSLGALVAAPERQVAVAEAVATMEAEEEDWYDGESVGYAIWPEVALGEIGYDGIEIEHASARRASALLPTITPEMRLQWERIAALRAGLEEATTYYEVFAIRRALAEAIRA